MNKPIAGFSKLSKEEKIRWIAKEYFSNPDESISIIQNYWNSDAKLQQLHDEFIENTITNFYLPLGVAPNFLINGKYYTIPMAIEESSVVAAAAKAAKFWSERGGFKATVLNTEKIGQVHFIYSGDASKLAQFFTTIKERFFIATETITANMQKRGGGILDIVLKGTVNCTLAFGKHWIAEKQNRSVGFYTAVRILYDTFTGINADFIKIPAAVNGNFTEISIYRINFKTFHLQI